MPVCPDHILFHTRPSLHTITISYVHVHLRPVLISSHAQALQALSSWLGRPGGASGISPEGLGNAQVRGGLPGSTQAHTVSKVPPGAHSLKRRTQSPGAHSLKSAAASVPAVRRSELCRAAICMTVGERRAWGRLAPPGS